MTQFIVESENFRRLSRNSKQYKCHVRIGEMGPLSRQLLTCIYKSGAALPNNGDAFNYILTFDRSDVTNENIITYRRIPPAAHNDTQHFPMDFLNSDGLEQLLQCNNAEFTLNPHAIGYDVSALTSTATEAIMENADRLFSNLWPNMNNEFYGRPYQQPTDFRGNPVDTPFVRGGQTYMGNPQYHRPQYVNVPTVPTVTPGGNVSITGSDFELFEKFHGCGGEDLIVGNWSDRTVCFRSDLLDRYLNLTFGNDESFARALHLLTKDKELEGETELLDRIQSLLEDWTKPINVLLASPTFSIKGHPHYNICELKCGAHDVLPFNDIVGVEAHRVKNKIYLSVRSASYPLTYVDVKDPASEFLLARLSQYLPEETPMERIRRSMRKK